MTLLSTIHENGGVDLNNVESAIYKLALKSPVWVDAMKEKLSTVYSQSTWSLVSLPSHKKLVRCK